MASRIRYAWTILLFSNHSSFAIASAISGDCWFYIDHDHQLNNDYYNKIIGSKAAQKSSHGKLANLHGFFSRQLFFVLDVYVCVSTRCDEIGACDERKNDCVENKRGEKTGVHNYNSAKDIIQIR